MDFTRLKRIYVGFYVGYYPRWADLFKENN